MKIAAFASAFGLPVIAQTADQPFNLTMFGAWGVSLAILVWVVRDVTTQRNKAQQQAASFLPVLQEVTIELRDSNRAHQAGAEATKAMTETMRHLLPGPELVGRIERVLQSFEQRPPR